MQKTGKLYGALVDLMTRYDDVIVDSGGHDSIEFRTALAAADHLYAPVRASQSDLWTLEALASLVEQARELNPSLGAHLVLSMVPTNPSTTEMHEALGLLAEYPTFGVCRSVIRDRKPFRDAMRQGRGVLELIDVKAAAELDAFAKEVMEHGGIQQGLAAAS